MKPITLLAGCAVFIAAASLCAQQPPSATVMPQVSLSEGTELVQFARQAMREYIDSRADANRQAIPEKLQQLARRSYPAAITLRDNGTLVAQVIRQDNNVCRAVISAALAAMRSPRLGDRVTASLLDKLTVEVEILGNLQPAEGGDLPRLIMPGWTGLKASRGMDETYLLPSAAYEQGLDAEAIAHNCLTQLPAGEENASLPVRWGTFLTAHFVGYDDGMVVPLYRGKLLFGPGDLDERTVRDSAMLVARYLIAHQDASGRYLPAGAVPSMRQHLYATYAMAQLARASANKELAASANAALRFAVAAVKHDDSQAVVIDEDPAEQLAGSALLVLATGQMPPDPKADAVRKELIAGLRRQLDLAVSPPSPADKPSANLAAITRGAYLAYMAISQDRDYADSNDFKEIGDKLAQWPALDAETEAWRLRCGLGRQQPYDVRQITEGMADEIGGFAPPGQSPTTLLTALEACNLAAAAGGSVRGSATHTSQPASTSPAPSEGPSFSAAQRFCCQMLYKPRETYLAPKDDDWIGGVRESPDSARITLDACAAAIEAFLR